MPLCPPYTQILIRGCFCFNCDLFFAYDETFKAIEEEIIESLKNAGKLDGIILCLHGALVAESYDDCEGKLLTDIRNLVGNEIPISLTLDYHANLTKLMLCKALLHIAL